MNPALQYRNYGKSLKRVLIPALQYRNSENAKKKSDRQYRTFEASELRSNDSIANLSFCERQDRTLGRRRFEAFGRNPSRTEGKSLVFTASGSDLPCPCGDARLARDSMS